MLWLLKWLLLGHVHHWKEDSREDLYRGERRVGLRIYCTCTKCGKPKGFNLSC